MNIQIIDVSDAVWSCAQKLYSIKNSCSYLDVTNNVQLNWIKWMEVMNYEGECIKNMEWVKSKENSIETNNYSYLAVTDDVILNWQNFEW